MLHLLNIASSTLASSLRLWNGMDSCRESKDLDGELILFDQEGNAECRLVREVLTELNMDVTIMPCPMKGKHILALQNKVGKVELPVLYDPSNESRHLGSKSIIDYLSKQYGHAVTQDRNQWLTKKLSELATLIRGNAGLVARPSLPAQQPLTLYSFEASPFSRLVRERLCELELPYHLVNLGKQQWSDMGMAKARFTLGAYRPVPGSKREAFHKQYGNVQVPFLVDPNTNISMFESKDILNYLEQTYAQ